MAELEQEHPWPWEPEMSSGKSPLLLFNHQNPSETDSDQILNSGLGFIYYFFIFLKNYADHVFINNY